MGLTISTVPGVGETAAPTDVFARPPAPSPEDVALFQSLRAPADGQADTLGARLLGGIKQASEHLQQRSNEFERSVRSAQRSLDPVEMLKTAHLLANYNQETMVTAKVVNKATQSLDQLSKLQ